MLVREKVFRLFIRLDGPSGQRMILLCPTTGRPSCASESMTMPREQKYCVPDGHARLLISQCSCHAVINAINDYLFDGADGLLEVFLRTYPTLREDTVRQVRGVVGLTLRDWLRLQPCRHSCSHVVMGQMLNTVLGFVQDAVDRYFDKFEVRW